MKTRLDHLNLTVKNLDETVAWYGRVFGFEKVEQGTYEGSPWAILKKEEALLCCYEHPSRDLPDADQREASSHLGINHFGLTISDRAQWEDIIKSEKLDIDYGGAVRWPHSFAWYLHDPNGYRLEVVQWDDDQIAFG